jgi:hypothetical protein
MKTYLMFPNHDFDVDQPLPANTADLVQDLNLAPLLDAMAGDDSLIRRVMTASLVNAAGDVSTVHYRQDVLDDALHHADLIRRLYTLAVTAVADQRRHFWLGSQTQPSRVVLRSVQIIESYLAYLRELRDVAAEVRSEFASVGFQSLFASLVTELSDSYLDQVAQHVRDLKFRDGTLMSAAIGANGSGRNYTLRDPRHHRRGWRGRLGVGTSKTYSFDVPPRDEAGFQALTELLNRGTNSVVDEVGQAADHIAAFFTSLRVELAFYVGCLNLRARLAERGETTCRPEIYAPEEAVLEFRDLRDTSLILQGHRPVIGNDTRATGRGLIVVTGANSGGKSTYLRSVGLALVMGNAGMFVTASSLSMSLHGGVWTHFAREEDATLTRGRFEEELSRMSEIVTAIQPRQWILLNESFSSTNEREGSDIADQVIRALLDSNVRVLVVTHLYDLATTFQARPRDSTLFLQATRREHGRQAFRLETGDPLPTSFADDVLQRIGGFEEPSSNPP